MGKLNKYIELLKEGKSLDKDLAIEAFGMIAEGEIDDGEIKDFLLTINDSGISENLLFGAAKAFGERSIKIKAPDGAIDVCGTGGDKSNSLNISTTVAIIVASTGIAVAKHGNKAVSSKSGSADIFSEIGVDLNKPRDDVEKALFDNNLAFIFAPLYHPAFKYVGPVRSELGIRTIFNFLGPLLNPADVKRQLIGCSDKNIAKIMLSSCKLLGKEKCFVVTSEDGMDEISISANTNIYSLDEKGNMGEEIFNPDDYGFKKRDKSLIEGKDPKYNAQKLLQLLKGDIEDEKMEAYFDIVTLNTAAALIIAGKYDNFLDAINFTQHYIKSGKSHDFLKSLK